MCDKSRLRKSCQRRISQIGTPPPSPYPNPLWPKRPSVPLSFRLHLPVQRPPTSISSSATAHIPSSSFEVRKAKKERKKQQNAIVAPEVRER